MWRRDYDGCATDQNSRHTDRGEFCAEEETRHVGLIMSTSARSHAHQNE